MARRFGRLNLLLVLALLAALAALPPAAAATASDASANLTATVPEVGVAPNPFPAPFDTILSYANLTTACAIAFQSFIGSTSLSGCKPFSLLLSSSTSFYALQTNASLLVGTLDKSCSARSDACQYAMAKWVETLSATNACAVEIEQENALVMQAITALQAYPILSTAACQRDSSTSLYCYAEAAFSPSPSALYFYLLPLGTPLPKSSTSASHMSCSSCTRSLLSLYPSAGVSENAALARTYVNASSAFLDACGGELTPVAESSTTSGARGTAIGMSHSGLLGGALLLALAVS